VGRAPRIVPRRPAALPRRTFGIQDQGRGKRATRWKPGMLRAENAQRVTLSRFTGRCPAGRRVARTWGVVRRSPRNAGPVRHRAGAPHRSSELQRSAAQFGAVDLHLSRRWSFERTPGGRSAAGCGPGGGGGGAGRNAEEHQLCAGPVEAVVHVERHGQPGGCEHCYPGGDTATDVNADCPRVTTIRSRASAPWAASASRGGARRPGHVGLPAERDRGAPWVVVQGSVLERRRSWRAGRS
jgi:hypothetical protein